MDEKSAEHITPIYLDLLERMILPRAGLRLIEHRTHPENDFPLTRRRYLVPLFLLLARVLGGVALTGDCHLFVLKKTRPRRAGRSGPPRRVNAMGAQLRPLFSRDEIGKGTSCSGPTEQL